MFNPKLQRGRRFPQCHGWSLLNWYPYPMNKHPRDIHIYIPIGSMYGIYANIGGILMGSMLPYIAAPRIRHGICI